MHADAAVNLSRSKTLFAAWAILFQAVLIVHFALRKWAFDRYTYQYGWIVYALGVIGAVISVILLLRRAPWLLWAGGFIYLLWAIYGYVVEYVMRIPWRNPPHWPVLGPYVFLYLATVMFYWWPIGLVSRPLWYFYGVLFAISTFLNVTSHRGPVG
jgi:hypothetical protein